MLDKGNMSLICLVDSLQKEEYQNLQEILWSALDFFGMPYEVLDLSKNKLSSKILETHSAIVIAQEHLGETLSEDDIKAVVDTIKKGVGFVCFDGDLHRYKKLLKDTFGLRTTENPTHMPHLNTNAVRIWDNDHFISFTKDLGFIHFNKPVDVGNIVDIEREHRLLMVIANSSGCPALIAETYGRGRIVLFALSPKVWMNDYLGHGGGIDDIFWRSIVWAARKPFVMLAMPPFVTIRIDDCSGANSFEWITILNKHGYIPHVSLFTQNITEKGAKTVKELYNSGLAEFSVHAFTWTKQIYWKPKTPVDHSEGDEYNQNDQAKFFKELDELQTKLGIEWSHVLTAHFGEVGKRVVPFLKQRGIIYLGMPYAFGVPYGVSALGLSDEKLKRLKPFGGQAGVIDYHPDDTELFIASPSYSDIPKPLLQMLTNKGAITPEGQIYDFLWESSRVKVDIELGAWYAAFGIKHCLDCLSFVVLVTHEQNIAVLNNEEWNRLLSRVNEFTLRYEKIYKSWSYISEYAENLFTTKLTYVNYNASTKKVEAYLEGNSSMPLYLHVFKDFSEQVERTFKELPPYNGRVIVELYPSNLLYKKL